MAFGKKKHGGLKLFALLLGGIVVIGGLTVAAYLLYETKISAMSETYEAELEVLKFNAYELKRTVWMTKENIKAGTQVQADLFYSTEISSSLTQEGYMTENDFGKVLLIDLETDTPVMKSMLFEELIGKDTREEELNMIFLPTNLEENHFVDVRIGFPNGEDYIVLTKMKVRNVDLANNTLWLWMEEKEMLTLSSAIVDAYLHKGTKLYTVTYVAPMIQEEAIQTYPVNVDVLKIIQNNPNILDEAKKGLSSEIRKLLDVRLLTLSEEALTSVDSGIKQEESDRAIVVNENETSTLGEDTTTTETTESADKEATTDEGEGNQNDDFY